MSTRGKFAGSKRQNKGGPGDIGRAMISGLLVVLALLVCGCGEQGGKDAKDAKDAGGGTTGLAREHVNICVLGVSGLPLSLALENGAFARQGVDVTLMKSRSGAHALESMFQGECDMATPAETPVVMQSFQRQDFSIVATLCSSDNALRILADRRRGIENPQDLRGKRLLVFKGSVNQFFLEMFLAKNGIGASEVEILVGGVPDVSAAFAAGSIDAFCQTDVLIDKPLMALGDNAVVLTSPGLVLSTFNLAATNRFIKERPEAIRRVLSGLLDNEKVFKKVPDEAMLNAFGTLDVDRNSVSRIVHNYRWNVVLEQVLLLSMEQEAQWAMDSGLVKVAEMPNYLQFVHPDILRSLRPEAVTMLR